MFTTAALCPLQYREDFHSLKAETEGDQGHLLRTYMHKKRQLIFEALSHCLGSKNSGNEKYVMTSMI